VSYSWMPILGEFDTSSEPLVFKGHRFPAAQPQAQQPETQQQPSEHGQPPSQPRYVVAAGLLLSNVKTVNGKLQMLVRFEHLDENSVCEFVIGYDVKTKRFVAAGLGGSGAMFSIREWTPAATPQGTMSWTNIELTGDRRNLKAERDYSVEAHVNGSNISLRVDSVEVAGATLPTATNQPRQVGIFCLGDRDIRVSRFAADVDKPKAFIVMQFSSPYNEVYSHVIKVVCDEQGVEAVRADEIYGPGLIIKDIIDRIERSQVIIADISPINANVYFEVGYALALGKPIILLAQHRGPEARLPFDLSSFRVLFYDDTIGGKPKLEDGLRNHLREVLGSF